MASMTSKLKVFLVLLGSVEIFCYENQETSDTVKEIFLSKPLNSTELDRTLKYARESYQYLRNVEKEPKVNEKEHFVRNYANFLLKLLNEIQTKDINVYQFFTKENSFLKDYNASQPIQDFNVTELKIKIEDLQSATEWYLIAHFNSSNECHSASEVLALDEKNFDSFLKEHLRTNYTDYGYFVLEVFATLIGLSWGVISTVIYYTQTGMDNMS